MDIEEKQINNIWGKEKKKKEKHTHDLSKINLSCQSDYDGYYFSPNLMA